MRIALSISLLALTVATHGHAQTRIWRCGNTYTNAASEAKAKNCKPVEGGNVTVVEGTRVHSGTVRAGGATPQPVARQRVDSGDQRARDAEARIILEAELKNAEARRAELLKEYNDGEPEMLGPEHRNQQKYLDRIAELKANIARSESDIAGLKRELARAGSTATAAQ